MAVNEGWYGKNGSKWQSMPDLMLRYRSAAFFGRIYAPELLMGLPSSEESRDIITVTEQEDGSYAEDNMPAAPVIKTPQSKSATAAAKAPIPSDVVDAEVMVPPSQPTERTEPPARTTAAASAAANKDTGELPGTVIITVNQVKYLTTKIAAIELPESAVDAMLMRVGAPDLQGLTIEQFDVIKSELLGMGA
jgi:hypothetical protein